jgi:hypothetical protein
MALPTLSTATPNAPAPLSTGPRSPVTAIERGERTPPAVMALNAFTRFVIGCVNAVSRVGMNAVSGNTGARMAVSTLLVAPSTLPLARSLKAAWSSGGTVVVSAVETAPPSV